MTHYQEKLITWRPPSCLSWSLSRWLLGLAVTISPLFPPYAVARYNPVGRDPVDDMLKQCWEWTERKKIKRIIWNILVPDSFHEIWNKQTMNKSIRPRHPSVITLCMPLVQVFCPATMARPTLVRHWQAPGKVVIIINILSFWNIISSSIIYICINDQLGIFDSIIFQLELNQTFKAVVPIPNSSKEENYNIAEDSQ